MASELGSNAALVELIRSKAEHYLDTARRDETVLKAMREVDRAWFLPFPLRDFAYRDEPLPIGCDETTSQPSMVAFILDKLQIRPGHRILEVGSGCGYAAAVASRLCGDAGKVYACEVIAELALQMRSHLKKGYDNVHILVGDGSQGFPELAPFDRIFLSAGVVSGSFDRSVLIDQLTESGKLIYPEASGNLYLIEKDGAVLKTTPYYGVRFVPLTGRNS